MMKFLVIIFLLGGVMYAVEASVHKSEVSVKIKDLDTTLYLKVKKLKADSVFKLLGTGGCPEESIKGVTIPNLQTCLMISTHFEQENPSYIPIFILKNLKTDLKRALIGLYESVSMDFLDKATAKSFKWGTLQKFTTNTFGSASFYVLNKKNQTDYIVIGPGADLVFAEFEIDFSNALK